MKHIIIYIQLKSEVFGRVNISPVLDVLDEMANLIEQILNDEDSVNTLIAVEGL
jgi:hypothetical protein